MLLHDCSAIILAGGLSTRLGEDKADLLWKGRSLISHVTGALGFVEGEIIAVARPDQEVSHWLVDRIAHDEVEMPAGPLRGLVAGLGLSTTAMSFVVSCDAPCLQAPLLRFLREKMKPDAVAVVPEWSGRLQPMPMLIRKEALTKLYALLEGGERSPIRAIQTLPIVVVDEPQCRSQDPKGLTFVNINTMEDLCELDGLTADPTLPERNDHA
jgi:molybdopterin-guanine dinucleotide biosynthesis protein A